MYPLLRELAFPMLWIFTVTILYNFNAGTISRLFMTVSCYHIKLAHLILQTIHKTIFENYLIWLWGFEVGLHINLQRNVLMRHENGKKFEPNSKKEKETQQNVRWPGRKAIRNLPCIYVILWARNSEIDSTATVINKYKLKGNYMWICLLISKHLPSLLINSYSDIYGKA